MLSVILKRVDNYIDNKESDRKVLQKEKEQLMKKLKIIRANKGKALMKEAAKSLARDVFISQTQLLHQENSFQIFQIAKVCIMKTNFLFARSVTLDMQQKNQNQQSEKHTDKSTKSHVDRDQFGFVSFRSKYIHKY